jgi:hypothetical protein
MERDLLPDAVKENGDPTVPESIETKRPASRPRAHFGRLGTMAIGLKV